MPGEKPHTNQSESSDEDVQQKGSNTSNKNPDSQKQNDTSTSDFYEQNPRMEGETFTAYINRMRPIIDKRNEARREKAAIHKEETIRKKWLEENGIKMVQQEPIKDRKEYLKSLMKQLDELLPKMAELYAKNRRLIPSPKSSKAFGEIEKEYRRVLDEYLIMKNEEAVGTGMHRVSKQIEPLVEKLNQAIYQNMKEFAGGNLSKPQKTKKEMNERKALLTKKAQFLLSEESNKLMDDLRTDLNAKLLHNVLEQETKLAEATVEALDKGSIYRKFVNKVINDKGLRGLLMAAGAAGIATTSIGAAAEAVTMGTDQLIGNIALYAMNGALLGGIAGGITSRQDSKVSAVRKIVESSQPVIEKELAEQDISKDNTGITNVTSWIMDQYSKANTRDDAAGNRKRTAIATGLGALAGALANGVFLNGAVGMVSAGGIGSLAGRLGKSPGASTLRGEIAKDIESILSSSSTSDEADQTPQGGPSSSETTTPRGSGSSVETQTSTPHQTELEGNATKKERIIDIIKSLSSADQEESVNLLKELLKQEKGKSSSVESSKASQPKKEPTRHNAPEGAKDEQVESAPVEPLPDYIEALRDQIGDDGIEIITSDDLEFNNDPRKDPKNILWSRLSIGARNNVIRTLREHPEYGQQFMEWLNITGNDTLKAEHNQ